MWKILPPNNPIKAPYYRPSVLSTMADSISTATRSRNMSRVRGKDTGPELLVRCYLHAQGLRYRLHDRRLPGTPDIILPRYRTIVFVHGCFWHGHEGCSRSTIPKTRTEFWRNKISRNVANDLRHQADLTNQGWKVLTVWTCGLRPTNRNATLAALVQAITGPPESDYITS
jgi:DNA mismatch endonuclease (patch repair protein)